MLLSKSIWHLRRQWGSYGRIVLCHTDEEGRVHMHWTLWRVVRLQSEVEWPTLVDDHGLGKSRGEMPERFSHPDLVD